MILLALTLSMPVAAPDPVDLKARAEAIVTIHRNRRGSLEEADAALREELARIEDAELEPEALKAYDTRTLEVLFDAILIAAETTERSLYVDVMENLFEECLRRGFYFHGRMDDPLHRWYVRTRRLDKAKELYERFPSPLRELPEIIEPEDTDERRPAVFTVSETGTLSFTPVDLEGPLIVSVVSPFCRFSRDVVTEIESDPDLTQLFEEHAINIYPGAFSLDAEDIARANEIGRFRYTILYGESGWPGFHFRSTPQFYFVRAGEVVHSFSGGPTVEFRPRLLEGLDRLGLSLGLPEASHD